MKQVLVRNGNILVENVPAPQLDPDSVLVETSFSLISSGTELSNIGSSDRSVVKSTVNRPARIYSAGIFLRKHGLSKTIAKIQGQLEAAWPIGYSCSGTVIQTGSKITDLQPGDRVACAGAGRANHAELVLVPRNLVAKIPEGCRLEDAASVTLGAIAMQGVRRADPRLGEIIAVIGLGLLGQITVQLLYAAGARVIGFDIDERRVQLSRTLGAEYAFCSNSVDILNEIQSITGHRGVDTTIITAASRDHSIAQQAMEITRKKGRVVVVGDIGLGLKRSPFYEKEIDFLISCSYGPGRYDKSYEEKGQDYPYAYVRWTENRNMQEYLRLISNGQVNLGPILERVYDIDQAPQAYNELRIGSEKPLGVLLRFPAESELKRSSKFSTITRLDAKPVTGKINIAIVGAGRFTKAVHLPNLVQLSNQYHVRAVVSATGSNAKETARLSGADYASTNYEDVLNDPEVDAVLISTRHNLHAQQTFAALKAEKHVFVEKPLALNGLELAELLKQCGASQFENDLDKLPLPAFDLCPKTVLTVGFNRRYSPAARKAHKLLENRQSPVVMLYRVNAGYIPLDHWIQTKEGGGRIIGEACHMLDLFKFLVSPAQVIDVSASSIQPRKSEISPTDNFSVNIRYGDGSLATLLYTALGSNDYNKELIELYTDGKIIVIDNFQALHIYGSKVKGWQSKTPDKGHLEELRSFADSIRKENSQPIPLSEIIETTRISQIIADQLSLPTTAAA